MTVKELASDKTLKIIKGNLYNTINPQQQERLMIIGGSETLTARCLDAGAIVLPVTSFSQIKQNEFHTVAAPLSIHQYADGAQWTAKAYEALKEGGRFIVDFAEVDFLPSASDFPYAETLTGYWERLRSVGFKTILFEQLTAKTAKEALLNGWTEITPVRFPVIINRFIAVK